MLCWATRRHPCRHHEILTAKKAWSKGQKLEWKTLISHPYTIRPLCRWPCTCPCLGAVPIKALMQRNPNVDWSMMWSMAVPIKLVKITVMYVSITCWFTVSGSSNHHLCGSSLDAIAIAARAIKARTWWLQVVWKAWAVHPMWVWQCFWP